MLSQLKQLCRTKKNKSIPITYSMIISPHNDHFSKHRMVMIKDVVFQFLSDIKRAL